MRSEHIHALICPAYESGCSGATASAMTSLFVDVRVSVRESPEDLKKA